MNNLRSNLANEKKSCSSWALAVAIGILIILEGSIQNAKSTEAFLFVIKKEEEKKHRRWSLDEWLSSKNRKGLMDEWLAFRSFIHIFEGMIGGDFGKYNFIDGGPYVFNQLPPITGKHSLKQGHLALYFSIVGLNFKYDSSDEKYNSLSGGIDLRVLGTSLQGTHLTFQAGLRNLKEDVTYANTYLGAFSTIYLLKFFGVEMLYRYFMITNSRETRDKREAKLYELSAFIDISFIRIYGTFFDEVSTYESGNLTYKKNRDGLLTGLKFYF